MKIYKATQGQNLYDVSLAIYGSIEGLLDLLAHNPDLSFDTVLKSGDELLYDEDYATVDSLVSYMHDNAITPANGERGVYYKDIKEPLRIAIKMYPQASEISLDMSGNGIIVIDWGDNSSVEYISLSAERSCHTHYFNKLSESVCVRIYGEFHIQHWNMSPIQGIVMPVEPLNVEEVSITKNNLVLQGLFLFRDTYLVKMNNMIIDSLQPIYNMSLSTLDLRNTVFSNQKALDDYLINLVSNNNQRRACKVFLTTTPSGTYSEPPKDSNGNYTITTGMEAIYVITHEPAWNEAAHWVFDIKDTIYQYENTTV